MCFSFNTSIISFTLGILAVIFAFTTRQYILGTLILFYAQMQLSEAMIWKGIDTNNKKLNQIGTIYGKYTLPTHNIAIGIGILLSIFILRKRKLFIKDIIPLIMGIIFFISIIYFYYYKKSYLNETYPLDKTCQTKTCQNNGNRLQWPYPHGWYMWSYGISLILLFIYIKPLNTKIFLTIIFTLTLFLTKIIAPNTIGSVWCFLTAILAPIIVIVNYFIIRNISNLDLMT